MSVLLKAFAKGISLSKIKTYLFGSDETQSNNLINTFCTDNLYPIAFFQLMYSMTL